MCRPVNAQHPGVSKHTHFKKEVTGLSPEKHTHTHTHTQL